ncbi:SMI1/KNR4 family protein [Streptomyces sp. NPDC026206]|uniref:SMI1/KNR4 family protein n=1 Tax=Streptomyces sp. NPDC026206 TaxID=3157089 RepID=UPI0033CE1600
MPCHENAGEEIDWADVQREWGTKFPRDYMAFMSEYGEGGVNDFLQIFQPLSDERDGPASGMRYETDNARGFIAEVAGPPELYGPPVVPLIAWGVDSSADILCWLTLDEDPDRWSVLVIGRHTASPVAIYECGMTDFLRRVILADFDECPLSGTDLWGSASPRFLGWREEQRLWADGVNPWTGEPDPYAGMAWD